MFLCGVEWWQLDTLEEWAHDGAAMEKKQATALLNKLALGVPKPLTRIEDWQAVRILNAAALYLSDEAIYRQLRAVFPHTFGE